MNFIQMWREVTSDQPMAPPPAIRSQELKYDVHVVVPRPGKRPLYLLDAADMLEAAAELHAAALREVEDLVVVLPAGAVESYVGSGDQR